MAFNLCSAPRRAMRGKTSIAADVGNRDRPVDGEEDCNWVGGEDLPFPLTLVLGCINGGGGKCGIFGGTWIGTLFRMCGILFIMATTVLSNGEVLELEILNWIFFVVVSSFSVLFFLVRGREADPGLEGDSSVSMACSGSCCIVYFTTTVHSARL